MKSIKTLLAVIVAVCLVMSLSVPVFASTVATTTAPAASEEAKGNETTAAAGETTAATGDATATTGDVAEPTVEEEEVPTHTHADGSVHEGDHTEEEGTSTGAEEEEPEAAWRKPVRIVLIVLEVITSIALGAVILLQSGKEAGLSGALTGNSESYMNKSGKGGLDKTLAKSTKWVALAWLLLTLALCLI